MALSNPQRHKEKLVQTTFIYYLTVLALSRIPKQPEAIQKRIQHQEKYEEIKILIYQNGWIQQDHLIQGKYTKIHKNKKYTSLWIRNKQTKKPNKKGYYYSTKNHQRPKNKSNKKLERFWKLQNLLREMKAK